MARRMLNDEHWSKLSVIMLKDRVYDSLNTEILWKVFYIECEQDVLCVMYLSHLTIGVPYIGALIYGSFVKAHQHSTGTKTEDDESIGKSVAGNTTKIYIALGSYGLPIEFYITGGEVRDSKAAPTLIDMLPSADYIIADRGYDSEALREPIRYKNSKAGNADIDWCLYKYQHLVENFFARLKQYRGIATRYDKLKRNYENTLALACCMIWLPM